MKINLKNIGLQLCTCIWIETMTGIGISMYLLLTQNYTISALTAMTMNWYASKIPVFQTNLTIPLKLDH